jgi:hypothetical protein
MPDFESDAGRIIVWETMTLISKYPRLAATLTRSETQLRADLQEAQTAIVADPNSAHSVRLGVVENWIGQELRRRTPGLNGPLR